MREPKTMEELHKIRIKNYKKRKSMTTEEYLNYIKKTSRRSRKTYKFS
ncbi:hypothetical protein SAMN04324257_00155 [Thermoanaerobacter thermohydrosulfuricus]|nr:hypothetical protein SAMN04324257_00155 [Thermoanaerobacter thermohydrosulfuricus]